MCPGKVRALWLLQSLMVVTGVQHAHLECAVFLEMSITPGNLEKIVFVQYIIKYKCMTLFKT